MARNLNRSLVIFVLCIGLFVTLTGTDLFHSDVNVRDSDSPHHREHEVIVLSSREATPVPHTSSTRRETVSAVVRSRAGRTEASSKVKGNLSNSSSISTRHRYENDGELILPPTSLRYRYPMHKKLPSISELRQGATGQRMASCTRQKIFPSVVHLDPSDEQEALKKLTTNEAKKKLEKEFDFNFDEWKSKAAGDGEVSDNLSIFYDREKMTLPSDGVKPWWITPEHSLPCTQEIQTYLWQRQNPHSSRGNGMQPKTAVPTIVSRLKAGAHGVGSALTLVIHDFLSGIMLDRVLLVDKTSWFFAPEGCEGTAAGRSWECIFASPSTLPVPSQVTVVKSAREAFKSKASSIRKANFDMTGLGRNDIPSLEKFFGVKDATEMSCYPKLQSWLKDPAHRFIMGTFEKGSDPMLTYMMAQITHYLLRAPQPWFYAVLKTHLPKVGNSPGGSANFHQITSKSSETSSSSSMRSVFIQERGEIAKFREYYNAVGCHNVDRGALVDFSQLLCRRQENNKCLVYVSGNTPLLGHKALVEMMNGTFPMSGTWSHPHLACQLSKDHPNCPDAHRQDERNSNKVLSEGEKRWGANSPVASWVDLYAGASSHGWVCLVQSNWCRVINWMRLTAGRADCPFIDLGLQMIANLEDRKAYCLVKEKWPMKPYSTADRDGFSLL